MLHCDVVRIRWRGHCRSDTHQPQAISTALYVLSQDFILGMNRGRCKTMNIVFRSIRVIKYEEATSRRQSGTRIQFRTDSRR